MQVHGSGLRFPTLEWGVLEPGENRDEFLRCSRTEIACPGLYNLGVKKIRSRGGFRILVPGFISERISP